MIPSKSRYSIGWSSTCTASRLSAGLRDGPLGTAHEFSTPSISSRRSKCRRVGACWGTMKRRPAPFSGASVPDGSGVRSGGRLAREGLSASSEGGRVGVMVVVHGSPRRRAEALGGEPDPHGPASAQVLILTLVGNRVHPSIEWAYGRALDWLRDDFLRPRFRADQDVFGR